MHFAVVSSTGDTGVPCGDCKQRARYCVELSKTRLWLCELCASRIVDGLMSVMHSGAVKP